MLTMLYIITAPRCGLKRCFHLRQHCLLFTTILISESNVCSACHLITSSLSCNFKYMLVHPHMSCMQYFYFYFHPKNRCKDFVTWYMCVCNLPLATLIAYMTISKLIITNILLSITKTVRPKIYPEEGLVSQAPVAPLLALFNIVCYLK